MSEVLYLNSMMSGLNNQRMGVVGLIVHAAKVGKKAAIPSYAVDFAPMEGRTPADYGRLPFGEVFDIDLLASSEAGDHISYSTPTEGIGLDTCFAIGKTVLGEAFQHNSAHHQLARNTLLSLQPTKETRRLADDIVEWLPKKTFALQLRIERDWHIYLEKKFGTTEMDTPEQFFTVDPGKIARKVSATNLDAEALWLCCDEADLVLPIDAVREEFRKIGLKLFFKSDLPRYFSFPEARLKRAFLEQAICQRLPGFIGLSLSTFTQTLWLENKWTEKGSAHYVYNSPGADLLRR